MSKKAKYKFWLAVFYMVKPIMEINGTPVSKQEIKDASTELSGVSFCEAWEIFKNS